MLYPHNERKYPVMSKCRNCADPIHPLHHIRAMWPSPYQVEEIRTYCCYCAQCWCGGEHNLVQKKK